MNMENKIKEELLKDLEYSYITAEDYLRDIKKLDLGEKFETDFSDLVYKVYEILEHKSPKIEIVTIDEFGDQGELPLYNKIEYPLLEFLFNRFITHKSK